MWVNFAIPANSFPQIFWHSQKFMPFQIFLSSQSQKYFTPLPQFFFATYPNFFATQPPNKFLSPNLQNFYCPASNFSGHSTLNYFLPSTPQNVWLPYPKKIFCHPTLKHFRHPITENCLPIPQKFDCHCS